MTFRALPSVRESQHSTSPAVIICKLAQLNSRWQLFGCEANPIQHTQQAPLPTEPFCRLLLPPNKFILIVT